MPPPANLLQAKEVKESPAKPPPPRLTPAHHQPSNWLQGLSSASSAGSSVAQQPKPAATIPSPVDTYPISDRGSDSSVTDTDDPDDPPRNKPHKHVPTWARGEALQSALRKQQAIDPSHFFHMTASSCDLHEVFDKTNKPFKRRTSSQNWSQDLSTYNERLKYRQEMGFTPNK